MDVTDEAITNDQEIGHLNNNISSIVWPKILNHFIRGKIALTHGNYCNTQRLELLESLVKLVRNKRNERLKIINLTKVEGNHVVQKVNIHKNHCKTLHLLVEINNNLLEGLVDIGASMLMHDVC
jgi:coenzyme F420-reducing hydrogenase delta subunit